MSTRALYTFHDGVKSNAVNVYVHHDGYPEGAARKITAALALAWPLPRFEADEFAAAFVAANKRGSGGVRIMPTGEALLVAAFNCSDVEYVYEVRPGNGGVLIVQAYAVESDERGVLIGKRLYSGPQAKLQAWADAEDAKVRAWIDAGGHGVPPPVR